MTQMLEMPRVQSCTVTSCGYNHDGCTAFAVTIGSAISAECDTYVTGDKGGMGQALAQVGACKRSDCTHNENLECRAPAIVVGESGDKADCMTYEKA
ncbi:DUF1540 domain-containing protein [Paractinoplanes brasiliensis]|uniref:Uncharacterized protein DUF1540 n=1 Tax=Paractinoplanes brasiliensis TaxID=52695 RepID=A0A4R6K183_9ACTN|nr:DUF1540 domain-containing protein [Actinoplanes brasiliensis]TDO41356.1 uncharacterized protein DUF1540 [Actinoplanes brasiliensis]GID27361.1 hypothetical protein Abr02nite_23440 [Actinoplanes brasiliensis]